MFAGWCCTQWLYACSCTALKWSAIVKHWCIYMVQIIQKN